MTSNIGTIERGAGVMAGGADMDLPKIEELLTAIAEAGPGIKVGAISAVPFMEALVKLVVWEGRPPTEQWNKLEAIAGIGSPQRRAAQLAGETQLQLEKQINTAREQPTGPETQIKDLKDQVKEQIPGESPINPLLLEAEGQNIDKQNPVPAQEPNSAALNDGLPDQPETPDELEQEREHE